MTINQAIGMPHGEQEPMESGRYHGIIHRDIIHHDVIHHDIIHFAFTKMGSQNSTKIHPTSAINLHIFRFDFSKAINL